MKLKDLTGKRFGKLRVISRAPNKKTWTMWNCICDCGIEKEMYSTHLLRKNTKSCGCEMVSSGKDHVQWTGHGQISGGVFASIARAKRSKREARKSLPFDIDIEYVSKLYEKQKGKCALSGVDLIMAQRSKKTASLDRIDSSKGYIQGNVQWVHKDINRMKNVFPQEYFIEMCKKVAAK